MRIHSQYTRGLPSIQNYSSRKLISSTTPPTYLQRSSMRRACRKAFAVSFGAITKRLSKRPQTAERRDGVTKIHGLDRGADRDESQGGRDAVVSWWPVIENKYKSYYLIYLCLDSQVQITREKFFRKTENGFVPHSFKHLGTNQQSTIFFSEIPVADIMLS
jgi:hypothetical protein